VTENQPYLRNRKGLRTSDLVYGWSMMNRITDRCVVTSKVKVIRPLWVAVQVRERRRIVAAALQATQLVWFIDWSSSSTYTDRGVARNLLRGTKQPYTCLSTEEVSLTVLVFLVTGGRKPPAGSRGRAPRSWRHILNA